MYPLAAPQTCCNVSLLPCGYHRLRVDPPLPDRLQPWKHGFLYDCIFRVAARNGYPGDDGPAEQRSHSPRYLAAKSSGTSKCGQRNARAINRRGHDCSLVCMHSQASSDTDGPCPTCCIQCPPRFLSPRFARPGSWSKLHAKMLGFRLHQNAKPSHRSAQGFCKGPRRRNRDRLGLASCGPCLPSGYLHIKATFQYRYQVVSRLH